MRARKCLKTRKLLIGSPPPPPPFPILAVGQSFFSLTRVRKEGGGRLHKTLELGLSISNSRRGGGEREGVGLIYFASFSFRLGERKRCHLQIGFREKSNVEKNGIFFQRRNSVSKGLNSGTVTSADNLDLLIDILKTPCFPPQKRLKPFFQSALLKPTKTKCSFFSRGRVLNSLTCQVAPPHPHSIADGPFGGKSENDRTNSICRKILLQRDNNRI